MGSVFLKIQPPHLPSTHPHPSLILKLREQLKTNFQKEKSQQPAIHWLAANRIN